MNKMLQSILGTVIICVMLLPGIVIAQDAPKKSFWGKTVEWLNGGPPLPNVPVELRQRKALVAEGYVAMFKNPTASTISFVATFSNSTFHSSKTFNIVLEPGESKEIGGFEGWAVHAGETVTLSAKGFSDTTYPFNDAK